MGMESYLAGCLMLNIKPLVLHLPKPCLHVPFHSNVKIAYDCTQQNEPPYELICSTLKANSRAQYHNCFLPFWSYLIRGTESGRHNMLKSVNTECFSFIKTVRSCFPGGSILPGGRREKHWTGVLDLKNNNFEKLTGEELGNFQILHLSLGDKFGLHVCLS